MTQKQTESMQRDKREQCVAWLTLLEMTSMEKIPETELDAVLARLQRQADAAKFENRRRKHHD